MTWRGVPAGKGTGGHLSLSRKGARPWDPYSCLCPTPPFEKFETTIGRLGNNWKSSFSNCQKTEKKNHKISWIWLAQLFKHVSRVLAIFTRIIRLSWSTTLLSSYQVVIISHQIKIRFQPFSVGMLAVEQGEDTSNVNCWMDIRKGRFPEVRTSNVYKYKYKYKYKQSMTIAGCTSKWVYHRPFSCKVMMWRQITANCGKGWFDLTKSLSLNHPDRSGNDRFCKRPPGENLSIWMTLPSSFRRAPAAL